jgi:putative membrane protein
MSALKPREPLARLTLLLLSAALCTVAALAHGGAEDEVVAPGHLWSAWSWDPLVVISLALSGWLYIRGLRALWRQAGAGRGIGKWEAGAFAAGWLTLVIALVSPLHPLGGVLFSAHMTQHELLMLVAAPLLVLGRPMLPLLWSLPIAWRRRVGGWSNKRWVKRGWRGLTLPVVAWTVHAIALWIWHAPPLFEATLHSELVHTLQHLSFFLSALLFCWALLHGPGGRMGYGAAVVYIFTTAVHSSILGALLTFARTEWYPAYHATTAGWGLTPLEDQQLGGLIMWVPAGAVYMLAGLILLAGWLRGGTPEPIPIEGSMEP